MLPPKPVTVETVDPNRTRPYTRFEEEAGVNSENGLLTNVLKIHVILR